MPRILIVMLLLLQECSVAILVSTVMCYIVFAAFTHLHELNLSNTRYCYTFLPFSFWLMPGVVVKIYY